MKKYTGFYTADAGKSLKNSDRILCTVTEDGEIYVSNGYALYKMNPLEYAATVQPVTCCEAGNWSMDKNGERIDDKRSTTLPRLFADLVTANADTTPLDRCPLLVQLDNKTTAAAYYNAANDFTALYNTKYIAAVSPSATLRATGPLHGAVAYVGDEPFAVILPIRPADKITRTVKAYFTTAAPTNNDNDSNDNNDNNDNNSNDNNDNNSNEIAALHAENEQLRRELTDAQREIERITAEAAKPEATTEPKTAAELIAERFTAFDGVTATIKGAQTAAPVVWLTGDTDRHADKLETAGAKWSNKKSAWYVRVA